MKWKSLHAEIRDALQTDEGVKFFESVLPEVRSNIRDGQNQIRRSLLILLFLISIFELLIRGLVSEASIGPFKLKDLSLLTISVPVLVAYIYHSITGNAVTVTLLKGLHNDIMSKRFPDFGSTPLRSLLFPPSTFNLINVFGDFFDDVEDGARFFFCAFSTFIIILFGLIMLFPIVFEIYAFWKCFSGFGFSNVLVWVSALVSLLLFTKSILNFKILDGLNPDSQMSL